MAVDSETYMAVCKQVQELRQQLAAANEENERVRQANLDVMMHFEDMRAAKEKVGARVAELEKCLSVAHQILNDQGATGSIMGRFRKALAGDAEQTGGES